MSERVEPDLTSSLREAPKDEHRWMRFVRQMYPAVMYTAFRMTNGDKDLSKDIAQEAFARFLKLNALERVSSDREALAYLRQTARHLAVDERRLSARMISFDDENRESVRQMTEPSGADEWLRWDLEKLAAHLNNDDQELLAMSLEGLTMREIAARLGVAYSTAAVRLHRMRQRLAGKINPISKGVKKNHLDRL